MIRPIVLLVLCSLASAAERPGAFRVIGPGGGGAQFNPTISPHSDRTVLVSCDMTGAYVTHNGGSSWRMFNLRGTVRFFVFDPRDPKTMYAQVSGLWRSSDGGETWSLIHPQASAIRSISMASDHAEETLVAEPNELGRITALAIDSSDSRVLHAAATNSGRSGLWISRDRGESWTRERDLPEPALRVWLKNGAVHVAGPTQIDGRPAPQGAKFTYVSGEPPSVYAISGEQLWITRDSGTSWALAKLPGTGSVVRAVAGTGDTVYASYENLEDGGAKWFGVAKSTDTGKTWTLPWKETRAKPAANITDAWITERFGASWGGNPLMLGVSPRNRNLVYATDYGRTLRSTDGGATWTAVYSRRTGSGWTTTGLDVTTSYGYHVDPFAGNRHFITYTDIGLFRSEDGGQSWTSATKGVPERWVNTTYWIEFDPQVRGRMWAVMSGTHDLPRPKMFRRTSPATYRGGVCRSDDGGLTWTVSSDGMPQTAPTHILLDPKSPQEARTLYVAAFGKGVYKSTDGGRTWALKNNGITQAEPFGWRLARGSDGTLYLVVARHSEDGSIGDARDGALYRSIDGAEHWTPVPLPAGVNGPNGLLVDPRDPKRLYLAAWARAKGTHGEGGGIFLSIDGGQNWKSVLAQDQHVYDVTADPRRPDMLYASGFESAAWRSTDRGLTWSRIPGYNFKWGHRVMQDPADERSVYITTFGGSVWHGRVDGDAKATLDIATPLSRGVTDK